MSRFPIPWLDLLITNSALGTKAPHIIAEVEAKVAACEAAGATVFPVLENRYRALEMVHPESARACLIGQDAYHGTTRLPDGQFVPQAMGLSFSVPSGARLPPSLRNIFKEMVADLDCSMPMDGDLSHWAEQGVLLLNSILSVEENRPKSHDKFGWQTITSAIVEALSKTRPDLVFILWGNSAKALRDHIVSDSHTIIESSHPSPIGGSAYKSFFGSRPFSRTNAALRERGMQPINWAGVSRDNTLF